MFLFPTERRTARGGVGPPRVTFAPAPGGAGKRAAVARDGPVEGAAPRAPGGAARDAGDDGEARIADYMAAMDAQLYGTRREAAASDAEAATSEGGGGSGGGSGGGGGGAAAAPEDVATAAARGLPGGSTLAHSFLRAADTGATGGAARPAGPLTPADVNFNLAASAAASVAAQGGAAGPVSTLLGELRVPVPPEWWRGEAGSAVGASDGEGPERKA
jgi:hypothetical protein